MGANSLATGMNAALVEAALEIARLPDLSPELLPLSKGLYSSPVVGTGPSRYGHCRLK